MIASERSWPSDPYANKCTINARVGGGRGRSRLVGPSPRCPRCRAMLVQKYADTEPFCIQCGWVDYAYQR